MLSLDYGKTEPHFLWVFLINNGMQSSTVKSYVSVIKKTLVMDGYKWNDNFVLVRSLAKACKIINDRVITRFPIHCGLLEMILFELGREYSNYNYLRILYSTIFAVCYYGLMRVGEVTLSPHVLKAKDVHVATNKDKMLFILYSSKTHDKSNRPQKIKITSNRRDKSRGYVHRYFCPFKLMRRFIEIRGPFETAEEQFFIFKDGSPVCPYHIRNVLRRIINKLGLEGQLYGMHSFRIGRTTDLIKYQYSVDEVKQLGRWRSNIIFRYIR